MSSIIPGDIDEALRQIADQGADLRRQVLARGIDRIDAQLDGSVRRENLHRSPRRGSWYSMKLGCSRMPPPPMAMARHVSPLLQRTVECVCTLTSPSGPVKRHSLRVAKWLYAITGCAARSAGVARGGCRAGRRCGAETHARAGKAPADERGVLQARDPHRHVEAFLDRSTTRSFRLISSSMRGWARRKSAHSGARCWMPKLSGALRRSTPLGSTAPDATALSAASISPRTSRACW